MAFDYGSAGGGTQPGGGQTGGGTRKNGGKDTSTQGLANLLSKQTIDFENPGGAAVLPALTPDMTANVYQQLAGLYADFELARSELRAQRIGIRAGFREEKAGIRANLIGGIAAAESDALARGVLGGSADLENRTAAFAAAAQQKAAARSSTLQQLAATRIAEQRAQLGLFQGQTAIQSGVLAYQQSELARQLEMNAVISGQEAQVDALRAIYDALPSFATGGRGKRPSGRKKGFASLPIPGVVGGITPSGFQTGGGF